MKNRGLTRLSAMVTVIILCGFLSPVTAQRRIQQMDPKKEEMDKQAKENEHSDWKEKISYGGNVSMTFSNIYSLVYLQPQIGYRFTEKFMAGAGVTYIYVSQKYSFYIPGAAAPISETVSDHIYGFNIFARNTLFGPLFAQAEYQPINFTSYNDVGDSKRIWTNALCLGGGVSYSQDGRGLYVLAMYDVLWQSTPPGSYAKSIYNSPFNFRVGFMF